MRPGRSGQGRADATAGRWTGNSPVCRRLFKDCVTDKNCVRARRPQTLYSQSREALLQPCYRISARGLALLLAAGCSAAAQTAPEPGTRDPNAATVIAEIALERGDCRTASETYAAAAQRGDLAVAQRASEVALGLRASARRLGFDQALARARAE